MGCAEKPNCVLVTDPVTTLQVPSEAYPCGMVRLICIMVLILFQLVPKSSFSGITFCNLCVQMAPSPVTPTGSISIMDGDFIELNDLDDQLDPEDISR